VALATGPNAEEEENMTRIKGTLREDQYTFLSYLAQVFLAYELSRKEFVDKLETHTLFILTLILLMWRIG